MYNLSSMLEGPAQHSYHLLMKKLALPGKRSLRRQQCSCSLPIPGVGELARHAVRPTSMLRPSLEGFCSIHRPRSCALACRVSTECSVSLHAVCLPCIRAP